MAAVAVAAAAIVVPAPVADAVPTAPGAVFDDFDDGDTSDWIFFGGVNAGGGGGPATDRPAEGSHYWSTGWGGEGAASGFYGGTFKNLPDGGQVALPADPWFNMWVLNQSDATVDQYTLELTLREDTDGNGWTSGAEDSIGLDTVFTSAQFDDQWTLLSAPLSSWFDRGTGGNGVFDGDVDEMVIVLGGVQGGNPSVIEVDFDTITFTSGAPAGFDEVVFDDMEHGDPFGNGWFAFNGSVGGGGISPNAVDLPPALGGAFSLETGWGSGGAAGFYGGFGRTNPSDISGTEHFNFWINPDAGQDYTLEINLQEDDDGNGAADPATDDEFQYDCVVGPAGPCATAGGGWQLVSIPLDDFFDDNSFFTGGNGVLDPTPTARGGNGELINALMVVVGSGTDVNFRTDYWAFSATPIVPDVNVVIDDFESGLPFGSASPDGEPIGFYTFKGDGSVSIATTPTPPAPTLPAIGTPNNVMKMDVDVASFAGYIHAFENPAVDAWVTQDWSTSEGIRFWMFGNNSGTQMFIDILDNRNPGSTTDDAERWTVAFVDDFTGWQQLEFPFPSFVRKEIGNGAPNDGLGLFEMHGYAIGTLGTGGPKTFHLDHVELYGIAEPPALAVNLSRQNTFVEEGTTGAVGVKLNRPMGPADPAQVSIDYATERSNATPGEEFIPTSGTLTFTNGGATELFFPVETFDDTKFEGDEQIVIRLTNPVDVERGALFQGSVLIDDNDPFDAKLLDDFEQGAFLWETDDVVDLEARRSEAGGPDPRPGQDPVENVLEVAASAASSRSSEVSAGLAPSVRPALTTFAGRRFVDTRVGGVTIDGLYEGDGKLQPGSTYEVTIAGRGPVPADLAVVVMNVTAVDPEAAGFFTVYACDEPLPNASGLNYTAGVNVPNEVVVNLSAAGSVCVRSFEETGLLIDVVGYVESFDSIETMTQKRFAESREGAPTFDGQMQGFGRTTAGSTTTVEIAGRGGVPSDISTAIVNVGVVDPTSVGFVTVHPCLATVPTASSINHTTGVNRANELFAQVDADGNICIFTEQDVDLIVDVVGWVEPSSGLVSLPNARYAETREGALTFDGESEGGDALDAGSTTMVQIGGRGGVSGDADAAIINLAAVDPTADGFMTVYPCTEPRPNASSLNFTAGVNGANEIIAALDDDGKLCVYTSAESQLLVDVVGYIEADAFLAIERNFPLGQDWTGTQSLDFWFNGVGSGETVTVELKDNRAPDPGPAGWSLAWADEFDGPAGTPPDPANWAYELGDTTPDGKNGWGNEELQYYTDDPDNAATDGNGNLVITLDEADGSQECYYGPCEFESARLITQNRAEFAYGRIESRLRVPTGGDGLWPAFWSLGTDITYNPWPGAGEIDFMEYVSRLPNEIFGTIHGPGYSGGASFNGIFDFGEPVFDDYHTFTVEWEPNLITWYVDGIQYHQAEPSDVPGPWAFDKPFFLLLNFAIGGNFGGSVDPANTYPQEYLVDYVRVYQGPDTAERFEATFVDAAPGWQEISIPITDFVRRADQPVGAPADGLGLDDVWGYGFELPFPGSDVYQLDLVRRTPFPPPTELVVTNLNDSGPGSLREALGLIADGGTVTFDPALAGGTLTLTSGQLDITGAVTVDASGAAPVTISGGGASRVVQVGAGIEVAMNDVVIRDGVAAPQGGGILNLGSLNLDRVIVTDNLENSAGPANFAFGGGGIYNGDGATLNLTDSTVSDNDTIAQPGGGVYGFFNSTVTVTRSTISGNVAGDVAGGLRALGDVTIVNSTISDNVSTAWHGGAAFLTDGAVSISNTTIVGNTSPGGTAGGLMVATFGAPVTVSIADNIIADNGTYNCQLEGGGAAVLTSLGGNVVTDASCAAVVTDQIVGAGGALIGPLADNGGPTLTHAPMAGSPAIDAAVSACPATDQRGVARPQGAGCDVGAVELVP